MSQSHFAHVVQLGGGKAQLWTVAREEETLVCKIWDLTESQLVELDKPRDTGRPEFLDHPDRQQAFLEEEAARRFFAGGDDTLLAGHAEELFEKIASSS